MKKMYLFIAISFLGVFSGFSQGFEIISPTAPMNVPRYSHAALTLPNGSVLVIGGHTSGFLLTSTAEIYSPQTDTWTVYDVPNPHDFASYIRLNDGKYLFMGGCSSGYGVGQSTVTTLYDPVSNLFTNGPLMNTSRASSTAAMLSDGKVLIVGNWYNTGDAEVYNPVSNTFTSVGIPISERANPLVFPCTDGSAVIIGGYGNYGSPNYTDVVSFDPTTSTFSQLASEIIVGESGWTTSWSTNLTSIEDMKLSNGNYVFMLYKPVSSTEYQYVLAVFDPTTKEISKINSVPEIPMYTGTDPNGWAFGLNMLVDKLTDYVYIIGVNTLSGPFLTRLYAVDPSNGSLSIPTGETTFDYYAYTASKATVNGDILLTGGSIDGSNFTITNEVKRLHPINSLGISEFETRLNHVNVFPNPVISNSFHLILPTNDIRRLEMYDISGRIVMKIPVQKNELELSISRNGLPSGIYLLRMLGDKTNSSTKVIFE